MSIEVLSKLLITHSLILMISMKGEHTQVLSFAGLWQMLRTLLLFFDWSILRKPIALSNMNASYCSTMVRENYSLASLLERTVSEGILVSMQTKSMVRLIYNITLRDQPVVPRGVTVIC